MAGAEVEDLALTASVAAPAAENLAAGEPAYKDKLIRLRNVEEFAVHLFLADLNAFAKASSNWVPWLHNPNPLLIVGFTPLKVAGCAHQLAEDLGEVA